MPEFKLPQCFRYMWDDEPIHSNINGQLLTYFNIPDGWGDFSLLRHLPALGVTDEITVRIHNYVHYKRSPTQYGWKIAVIIDLPKEGTTAKQFRRKYKANLDKGKSFRRDHKGPGGAGYRDLFIDGKRVFRAF
jgi:hypothetical protein